MGETVQSILRRSFASYRRTQRMPSWVHRAARALSVCQTAELGGHAKVCKGGHVNGVWYNSCRHRMCPQCSWGAMESWLTRVREKLLPCPHHHIIFTLPHELLPLWRWNRKRFADLLFEVAVATVFQLLADPQFLGGRSAAICAFQSWSETLAEHPHLHCLVPMVGLAPNGRVITAKKSCLLPSRVVAKLFRGRFLAALERRVRGGRWRLPPEQGREGALRLLREAARKRWTVRVQPRYGHGDGVAVYLARYMRGGPIKNSRIVGATRQQVSILHGLKTRGVVTLPIAEFLRRLFAHVPEHRFRSVRAYGLYHPAHREALERCRREIAPCTSTKRIKTVPLETPLLEAKGCVVCGEPLLRVAVARSHGPPGELSAA